MVQYVEIHNLLFFFPSYKVACPANKTSPTGLYLDRAFNVLYAFSFQPAFMKLVSFFEKISSNFLDFSHFIRYLEANFVLRM